ncbi:MAG: hypothetical protein RSD28_05085 [Lachnospiraceae bacterium]
MSQEKVDHYKEEKANRKKNMKKQKITHITSMILGTVAGVAIIGWVGYSGYGYFQSQKAENPTTTQIDLSAATDYIDTLYNTEKTDAQ